MGGGRRRLWAGAKEKPKLGMATAPWGAAVPQATAGDLPALHTLSSWDAHILCLSCYIVLKPGSDIPGASGSCDPQFSFIPGHSGAPIGHCSLIYQLFSHLANSWPYTFSLLLLGPDQTGELFLGAGLRCHGVGSLMSLTRPGNSRSGHTGVPYARL